MMLGEVAGLELHVLLPLGMLALLTVYGVIWTTRQADKLLNHSLGSDLFAGLVDEFATLQSIRHGGDVASLAAGQAVDVGAPALKNEEDGFSSPIENSSGDIRSALRKMLAARNIHPATGLGLSIARELDPSNRPSPYSAGRDLTDPLSSWVASLWNSAILHRTMYDIEHNPSYLQKAIELARLSEKSSSWFGGNLAEKDVEKWIATVEEELEAYSKKTE